MKMFHARNPESEARLKEMQASQSRLFKERWPSGKNFAKARSALNTEPNGKRNWKEAVKKKESRKKNTWLFITRISKAARIITPHLFIAW